MAARTVLFCWCSFISQNVCSRPNPRNVQISVLLQRKHSANTLGSGHDRNMGFFWNPYSENRIAIDPLPERNQCISWVVRMRESSLWQGNCILFQNSNLKFPAHQGPGASFASVVAPARPLHNPQDSKEQRRENEEQKGRNEVQNRYQWIRNTRHLGVLCW